MTRKEAYNDREAFAKRRERGSEATTAIARVQRATPFAASGGFAPARNLK
jgi:hypothetical protein